MVALSACVGTDPVLYLAVQHSLEAAENSIKQHEAFITTMDANDEKINAVLQFSHRLRDENHYAGDKITLKADQLSDRYVKVPLRQSSLASKFPFSVSWVVVGCHLPQNQDVDRFAQNKKV